VRVTVRPLGDAGSLGSGVAFATTYTTGTARRRAADSLHAQGAFEADVGRGGADLEREVAGLQRRLELLVEERQVVEPERDPRNESRRPDARGNWLSARGLRDR